MDDFDNNSSLDELAGLFDFQRYTKTLDIIVDEVSKHNSVQERIIPTPTLPRETQPSSWALLLPANVITNASVESGTHIDQPGD